MRSLAGFGLWMLASLAVAQEQKPIEEKLAAIRYPDLARRTRIQGDVRVVIDAGAARITSGNQLLSPGAIETAKALVPGADSAEILFHYQLEDVCTRVKQRIEPKGDAFDRMILRLLHLPTFRVVFYTDCGEVPPTRADFTRNPIEVWIYAREALFQPSPAAIL